MYINVSIQSKLHFLSGFDSLDLTDEGNPVTHVEIVMESYPIRLKENYPMLQLLKPIYMYGFNNKYMYL